MTTSQTLENPKILVGFGIERVVVSEVNLSFDVEVSASSASDQVMSVVISAGTKRVGTTAKRESDFVAKLGDDLTAYPLVIFTPGDLSQTVKIHLRDDDLPEPEEILKLRLTKPVGCIVDRDRREVEVVIQDNDANPVPNTNTGDTTSNSNSTTGTSGTTSSSASSSTTGGSATSSASSSSTSGTSVLLGVSTEVRFLTTNRNSRGNWQQLYGSSGYVIPEETSVVPAFVSPRPLQIQGGTSFISGQGQLSDIYLFKPGNNLDGHRIASGYTSDSAETPITFDLAFIDGLMHKLSLYFVDDRSAGSQTVKILDSAGVILSQSSIAGFENGIYLSWNIRGEIQLQITGENFSILTGIFFD